MKDTIITNFKGGVEKASTQLNLIQSRGGVPQGFYNFRSFGMVGVDFESFEDLEVI